MFERLPDGSPDPSWALERVRAFVSGGITAGEFCKPLDPLIDWCHTVEDANEIDGVDEDRFLMYAFAYGLAGICLPLGAEKMTLDEARDEAAAWIPYLERGQDAWERFVSAGGVPFPEEDD